MTPISYDKVYFQPESCSPAASKFLPATTSSNIYITSCVCSRHPCASYSFSLSTGLLAFTVFCSCTDWNKPQAFVLHDLIKLPRMRIHIVSGCQCTSLHIRHRLTAQHSNKDVSHHWLFARCRTTACKMMRSWIAKEHSACIPYLGSSIRYCMTTLHSSRFLFGFRMSYSVYNLSSALYLNIWHIHHLSAALSSL